MENDIEKNSNRPASVAVRKLEQFPKSSLAEYSEHVNFVQKIRVTTFVIQSLLKN